MSTTTLATPEVEIDKIEVEEGHNARRRFDPEALKRLAESIKKTGIVEPIVIRPVKDGYVLTAGERRLRAAKLAGLKRVPVTVRESDSKTAAFVENVHRERLDPVEEAEGLEALAAELGLGTAKAIAAEVGMSQAWVGVRRRLLKLPPKAREAISSGSVPLDAEPQLRQIAAASPRIAECVCELFARGDTETGDFCRDLDQLIYGVADAIGEGALEDPPTMVDPRHVRMSEVIDDREERDKLAARHLAAVGLGGARKSDPVITLGEVELTVARAAGVLLEYEAGSGEFPWSITFVTDKAMAADLVKVAIEREEKEAKKRAKAMKRTQADAAKESDQPDTTEQERRAEERAEARKEADERKAAARSYNERVGHALLKRRGPEGRKKYGLARAKAGAIALVLQDRSLAAAGLRLVMPQLQGLQTETGDGGDAKVAYAAINQAREFLVGRIEGAKSAAEVDELIADAQIAALLADEDALEPGEGAYRHDPAEEKVREILAAELKALAPRRSPRQRKEGVAS
ncbi:MAG: parB-like partition protein [Solirubrobacterales bacterium]|nr:parB-like partition protein [Solirubrobacterales bacterium]